MHRNNYHYSLYINPPLNPLTQPTLSTIIILIFIIYPPAQLSLFLLYTHLLGTCNDPTEPGGSTIIHTRKNMRDKRRAKNSAAKERRMSVSSASKTKASNLLMDHDDDDDHGRGQEETEEDVALLNDLTERFEAATALSPGACTKARSSTTAVMAQAQRQQTR